MTSAISVNIGPAAAKAAPQASGNAQATGQTTHIPSAEQVAHASQIAAEQGAVKVQLGKEKVIQNPKRVEASLDPEKEKEKSEVSEDAEKMEGETPYSKHKGALSVKI